MIVLVCGATGGLGQAVVEAFRSRGDDVVPVGRAEADLTRREEVEALWDRLEAEGRRPEAVVNITGGYAGGSLAEGEAEMFDRMVDLNLRTTWWSCREAARRLPDGGSIVNVSARSAVTGGAGAAAYSVAKAGVLRLTEVLALELKPRRVRVNVLLPALIDTPANRAAMGDETMKKAVAPEKIASVVLWLCSAEAEAVTGTAIPV